MKKALMDAIVGNRICVSSSSHTYVYIKYCAISHHSSEAVLY